MTRAEPEQSPPPASPRRRALSGSAAAFASLAALSSSGCSLFSMFGASKPKPEPLPQITGTGRLLAAWNVKLGASPVGFQPLYAGGSIWAASARGRVVRLEPATGKQLWRADLDQPLLSGVGGDGKVVVVASRDGNVIALNADGKRIWSAPIDSEAVAVPAVGDGVVLVRTSSNRVFAFDAQNGRRRWTFQRQNPPLVLRQTSLMTIDNGVVYLGAPGGRMLALGLDNGALRWESAVSQPKGSNEIERIADVAGATPVDGSLACAASYQGRLVCFDASNGRQVWTRDVPSATGVAMDSQMVSVVDSDDQVHAFSRTGGSLWRNQQLKLRELSAPVLGEQVVCVGDAKGLVHALSRDDGRVVGRASTDGSAISSVPIRAGDSIVVQTVDGGVYVMTSRNLGG